MTCRAPDRRSSVSPWIAASSAYSPRKPDTRITWFLDANEGRTSRGVIAAMEAAISSPSGGVNRYPSFFELEAVLAARWGVVPARVVVTAGGDDAISRICATRLAPGSRMLVHEPAFEMFGVYARSRGAELLPIGWLDGEAFPLAETVQAIEGDPSLGLASVVSPSNPTGNAVDMPQALAVADACARSDAAFLFDAAYGEFADVDPSQVLVSDGSAYVVRSFSKAYGLAGLRLGYAIAPGEKEASALRACGMPYPSSALSVVAAFAALADTEALSSAVATARAERASMAARLRELGARVAEPAANFVLARVLDPAGLAERLADHGIAIRSFDGRPLLADAVRISCPCDPAGLSAVLSALDQAKECIG
ncbi:MAG: hypothetical protein CVV51_11880 [Spirochaetae bacterium HGW-Spirochaetae-7]|jgi:histidinol-phosphate aminotransferase|nr:MAG: hypothetical protein CVV51_11880 [Spirochaetae bacterium HGW-Spirochaetae-7]